MLWILHWISYELWMFNFYLVIEVECEIKTLKNYLGTKMWSPKYAIQAEVEEPLFSIRRPYINKYGSYYICMVQKIGQLNTICFKCGI